MEILTDRYPPDIQCLVCLPPIHLITPTLLFHPRSCPWAVGRTCGAPTAHSHRSLVIAVDIGRRYSVAMVRQFAAPRTGSAGSASDFFYYDQR